MSAAFWPWYAGGAAVAAVAISYPLVTGRTLGVSGSYGQLIEWVRARLRGAPSAPTDEDLLAALEAETRAEFGQDEMARAAAARPSGLDALRSSMSDGGWLFPIGVLAGAAIASSLRDARGAPLSLGESFSAWARDPLAAALVLFAAGIAIGFGTRLSGGCTSGHGITGVALGERGSLVATAVFWSTGLAVAWAFAALVGT